MRSSSRRLRGTLLVAAGVLAVLTDGISHAQAPPPGANPEIIIPNDGTRSRFAVPDCIPKRGDDASREACRTLAQVLRNDLKFEGFFDFVPETLMGKLASMNPDAPNFKDWQSVSANILVVTRAEVDGGDLNVEVKVYYVSSGQTMMAKRYSGRADNPRIFAHQASDEIMALAQQKGVARSKIAFVSDRDATKGHPSKELYIMDYDGFNPRRVTVNGSLNILPAWSPDGRVLAYTSYRQGSPQIFLASIYEGKGTNLTGAKGGQAFAPAWSPDGKRIVYASNQSGNMEIWVANADGSGAHKLTQSGGSNTAPCFSPTGQEIAFTSSRGGTPQIYVMDSEGLNLRKLTTIGSYNDAPAWNPSKQYSEIAYTSRLDAGFEVAVVDLVTGQVRQITEGRGSCEYPAWAPNGRHLAFGCSRGNAWQITVSDREGRALTTLPAGPGSNAQPDWSP